ncbi:MAG: hypothetical protein J4O09_12900 [Chloroflexi bacterium]|nr:hypothetical protein [Chloroflexota bacterium]
MATVKEQLERVEALKAQPNRLNFSTISPIKIGMIGGHGTGPTITQESQTVMDYILRNQVAPGTGQ